MSPVSLSHATRLDRIPWQYFGSLTFREADMSSARRMRMVFALYRKICKPLRVHFPSMLWVLRLEEGEITRRRHLHTLIGGLPEWSVRRASCFAIMRTWQALGGGWARTRIYDPSLAGEDYIKKGLGYGLDPDGKRSDQQLPDRSLEGANAYEMDKFSSLEVLELTCSPATHFALLRHAESSAARRGRDMSRGRASSNGPS